LSDFESKIGFTMADCERVTLVSPEVSRSDMLYVVVLTAKPYVQKKVSEVIVGDGAGDASYQNRKFLLNEKSGAALYFHDERIFVAGTKAGVQSCLDQLASPKTEGALRPALKEAAGKHHVVAGVAGSGAAEALKEFRRGLPDGGKKFDAVFDAQSV